MTYPTILPKLTLDFANSRQLDPRITFSRSSSATYLHPDTGLITTAPSDVARFEEQGLLIEEARTNLLLHSEEFDDAAWTKLNATVTPNVVTAPDGSLTADKIVEDTSNDYHQVRGFVVGTTPSAIYSYSIFAKAGERSKIQLALGSSSAWGVRANATFDLAAGTILDIGSDAVSANIQALPDGWYRCELVGQRTTSVITSYHYVYLVDDSGNLLYTGDGTSGVYLWGGQLELGNFSTSYIPTAGATATRAADIASMTGTNFSSWYNQSEGTVLFKATTLTTAAKTFFYICDASSAADERISHDTNSLKLNSGGTAIINRSISAFSPYSSAIAYKANDFATSDRGVVQTVSSGAVPSSVDIAYFYHPIYSQSHPSGHISRLAYYPVRLSDEQLQALTA